MTPEYTYERAKAFYDNILKSGMFWEFHPHLTGNWDEDKDAFYEEYIERLEAIKNK